MSSSQPSSESPLASDERGTSQQEQRKGKESALINEKPTAESHDNGKLKLERRQWEDLIKKSYCDPARSPFVVSIFRVPNFLKGSKTAERDSYVPKRVSLGPYHYDTAELRLMDRHKGKALCQMKMRFNHVTGVTDDPNNIEFCHSAVKEIEKLEKAIRDSYEETIEYDGETLALMLSLDGSFVLEILRTLDEPHQECKYYDPIFKPYRIDNTGLDILNDILKLENQIPWIILQKLLQLELNSTEDYAREKLQQLIVGFLSNIWPFDFKKDQLSEQSSEEAADHLSGFLHSFIVSPPRDQYQNDLCIKSCCPGCITLHRYKVPEEKDQSESIKLAATSNVAVTEDIRQISCYIKCCSNGGEKDQDQSIMVEEDDKDIDQICIMRHKNKKKSMDNLPRAVELSNAGIKFEPCTSIWEIKFDRDTATIYLPWISISDHTEVLFRNLIAFEMCKLRSCETNYVAGYVYLMDRLIDSEEDVSLLRRKGIVVNMLGSDKEVAELFNGLCKGVAVPELDEHIFDGLKPKVIQHYKVQLAGIVDMYFSKSMGLIAAMFELIFGAAHIVILMISLYK